MERGRDAPLVTVTCQKWHCVSLSASCVSQEKKANQSLCQELAAEREKVARAEEKLVQGASVEAALQVMYMACTHAGMHQPNTCTPQACINPTRVHRRHRYTIICWVQVMYMTCTHAGMHQPNTCTPQA